VTGSSSAAQRHLARDHWSHGRLSQALDAAWSAFDRDPDELAARVLLAALLRRTPTSVRPEHEPAVRALLRDPGIDPSAVSRAGWRLVLGRTPPLAPGDEVLEDLAERLDHDDLAIALLEESPVGLREAELMLCGVRRWLLTANGFDGLPRLAGALIDQARLNGGAWAFDAEERARLGPTDDHPMAAAYLPDRSRAALRTRSRSQAADGAGLVDEQYAGWPYPRWRRVTVGRRRALADDLRPFDATVAAALPANPRILIAGCGTGREAATVALRYPGAQVTAIDLSAESLAEAERRCAAVGAADIRFVRLDLHRCAELDAPFDAIFCTGVLHHLRDPEAGWQALVSALAPGGVMKVGLYSTVARLSVMAARRLIQDLADGPIDDDTVRRARRRLIELPRGPPAQWVVGSRDFATLEGALDLLLHRREDTFDVPRIGRAVQSLGLRLLGFVPPTPDSAARYTALYPDDPGRRDLAHWAAFERREPRIFSGMYAFWCASLAP
jgi:SAM-dependent methyltransferase